MPGRKELLVTGEYYHVFNKGIDQRSTFDDKSDYKRMVETLGFYRFMEPGIRLSRYFEYEEKMKNEYLENLESEDLLVDVLVYELMPNHFHLIIRQLVDGGLSLYMSRAINSYTRYFNVRHERKGGLFTGNFKAVRIGSAEQMKHVSRYVHLNLYTAKIVNNFRALAGYEWSSLPEYLGKKDGLCNKEMILGLFGDNVERYWKFIKDGSDYQRRLSEIKKLMLE
ncbi:transposase [Patescibacteria group bacterium]|nr:transposase [Patescibacteria group bacterium]MBU1256369.1 transposase [Patescibacteria group bacterium]MBU1457608.1 transposase [Patescibacteria group bacterium]